MKIIKPSFIVYENLTDPAVTDGILKKIERIGRSCYKSESSICEGSAGKFIRHLIERQHEAMLEHASLTVMFTVDRGISHEIVRHRVASYAQESTRYANYSKDKFGNEITVIYPYYLNVGSPEYNEWYDSCIRAEQAYMKMLKDGKTPQEARAVLPTSLKTDIWMTANIRELRHIMKLRAAGTTGKPHPQMQEIMVPLLKYLKKYLPDVFFDIEVPE